MTMTRLLAGASALAFIAAQAPAHAADFSRFSHPFPPAARDAPGHRGGSEKALPSGRGKSLQHLGGTSGAGNLSYQVNQSISINNYSGATGYDVLILAADGLNTKSFDIFTQPDQGVSVIAMRGNIRDATFGTSNTAPSTVFWVGAHHEFGHTLGFRDMPDACWTTDFQSFNGPNYGHDVMSTNWNWDQTLSGTWPIRYLNFNDNTLAKMYP
jgi:hypothetical protein